MKSVIPWVLILGLLAGGYFLYAANQDQNAELLKLRPLSNEVESLRAENEQLKKLALLTNEVVRLRKDNEAIPGLRNQIRKLTDQSKQLNGQLQGAQGQRELALQQQEEAARLAAENANLKSQFQAQQQQSAQVEQANACINHLRQIDSAKQQWALENRKLPSDTPTMQDLSPYIPNAKDVWTCPGGGAYSINTVQLPPTCSTPGHALQ